MYLPAGNFALSQLLYLHNILRDLVPFIRQASSTLHVQESPIDSCPPTPAKLTICHPPPPPPPFAPPHIRERVGTFPTSDLQPQASDYQPQASGTGSDYQPQASGTGSDYQPQASGTGSDYQPQASGSTTTRRKGSRYGEREMNSEFLKQFLFASQSRKESKISQSRNENKICC